MRQACGEQLFLGLNSGLNLARRLRDYFHMERTRISGDQNSDSGLAAHHPIWNVMRSFRTDGRRYTLRHYSSLPRGWATGVWTTICQTAHEGLRAAHSRHCQKQRAQVTIRQNAHIINQRYAPPGACITRSYPTAASAAIDCRKSPDLLIAIIVPPRRALYNEKGRLLACGDGGGVSQR